MLDYISGPLAELNPAYAVVDVQGLGYLAHISLTTYDQLSRLGSGALAKLYVHEALREDAHLLFGFSQREERELFLLLITVPGVGPNTARMILSSAPSSQLRQSIASGDTAPLKAVKGVGAKTAQRIIVDLKDKIKVEGGSFNNVAGQGVGGQTFDEALLALTMLGFTPAMSQKALKKLFSQQPDLTVEAAIKQALKMM